MSAEVPRPSIERVGLMTKRTHDDVSEVVRSIAETLESHGASLLLDFETAKHLGRADDGMARRDMVGDVDLAVCLGGDGTFLSVARRFAPAQTPIIGVNVGHVGFLAEVEPAEFPTFLETYLDGRCAVDQRMMLDASLRATEDAHEPVTVLNDVVINKAALARTLQFDLNIGGEFVTRYRSDGLIIATPSGSTAYSLAAGGPIVKPELGAIIISPICPHALSQRPLLVPDTSEIRVRIDEWHTDVYLSMDGQVGFSMPPASELVVQKSERTARIVRDPALSFYELLRVKLGWGER